MTRIEVADGVELHVHDIGTGDPIVFVHGWPLDHRMFESQYPHLLDEGMRCIGIDLRGFGESDKPYGEYGYDTFADDVKAVLEAMDLDDVTLVGFSMGGGVVTRYMGRHDEAHVGRLALLGAASPCLIERSDYPQGLPEGALDDFIAGARAARPELMTQITELLFHQEQSEELKRYLWTLGMQASQQATVAAAETFRDADLRPDMESITVPTLVCHGTHDEIVPFDVAAPVLDDGIESADLVRFEESGHGLTADEPEKLNRTLTDFVREA
ncbi:Pimeloyl-ACP methyl ester carboxylesterase [Haloplanus vescus]|uniref:Pimeloyl-ACP methyl ester carboxylesterase n=1 Tax=Haloplanus vescus TaxID=555874 RepID=A0A1H3X422_9EURY|nr:alpha/beta hydrolase [Haloplanus vescus]SDZ94165.1 Pimeloyl-ACP methyl ester carboxylesterase [Haloplanus vescus]